jgi:hypothetical protein
MTQTDPKTPRGDQSLGDREELHVASGDMVDTVKSLIHEGNVRYLEAGRARGKVVITVDQNNT